VYRQQEELDAMDINLRERTDNVETRLRNSVAGERVDSLRREIQIEQRFNRRIDRIHEELRIGRAENRQQFAHIREDNQQQCALIREDSRQQLKVLSEKIDGARTAPEEAGDAGSLDQGDNQDATTTDKLERFVKNCFNELFSRVEEGLRDIRKENRQQLMLLSKKLDGARIAQDEVDNTGSLEQGGTRDAASATDAEDELSWTDHGYAHACHAAPFQPDVGTITHDTTAVATPEPGYITAPEETGDSGSFDQGDNQDAATSPDTGDELSLTGEGLAHPSASLLLVTTDGAHGTATTTAMYPISVVHIAPAAAEASEVLTTSDVPEPCNQNRRRTRKRPSPSAHVDPVEAATDLQGQPSSKRCRLRRREPTSATTTPLQSNHIVCTTRSTAASFPQRQRTNSPSQYVVTLPGVAQVPAQAKTTEILHDVRIARQSNWFPKTLLELWNEYAVGIEGRLPAKVLSRAQQKGQPTTYWKKKVFWDLMSPLVESKVPPAKACQRFYIVYGCKSTTQEILAKIKQDGANLDKSLLPESLLNSASLAPHVSSLQDLWKEYNTGLGGRKAAKEFTKEERAEQHKVTYKRRSVIWEALEVMIENRMSFGKSCQCIHKVFGNFPPTVLAREMMKHTKESRVRMLLHEGSTEAHEQ
jgi:Transcriptional activator of glycolytic enzymes